MAQQTVVNRFGNVVGWSEIKLVLFGRPVEGIMELSYGYEQEKEAVMAAGDMPVGVGRGNYKANVSMTLLLEEYRGLVASLPPGKRLVDVDPTDITVLTLQGDRVTKDVIKNFEFTGATKEVKQGDKFIGVKMGCFCTHIDEGVV